MSSPAGKSLQRIGFQALKAARRESRSGTLGFKFVKTRSEPSIGYGSIDGQSRSFDSRDGQQSGGGSFIRVIWDMVRFAASYRVVLLGKSKDWAAPLLTPPMTLKVADNE